MATKPWSDEFVPRADENVGDASRAQKVAFVLRRKVPTYDEDCAGVEEVIRAAKLDVPPPLPEDEPWRGGVFAPKVDRSDEQWREAVEKAILARAEQEAKLWDDEYHGLVHEEHKKFLQAWRFEGNFLQMSDDQLQALYDEEREQRDA